MSHQSGINSAMFYSIFLAKSVNKLQEYIVKISKKSCLLLCDVKRDLDSKRARSKANQIAAVVCIVVYCIIACTTAAALLSFIPPEVVAGFGAISTMLAATAAFLKPADKRNLPEKAARDFRSLMVQIISCETEEEYEKLWAEFNREIMEEPLVPKRFATNTDIKFIMSPELRQVQYVAN